MEPTRFLPDNMPAPSPGLAIMGALLHELEREYPGITERLMLRLEMEENVSRIVRLRAPSAEPAVREAIAAAITWLRRAAVVVTVHGKRKRR